MTIEELRAVPLLSGIEDAVLGRCLAENQVFIRRYAKGFTVHHQHEPCAALDVVLSGSLAAYSLSENGSSVVMFEFGKNGVVGANLLFGDNHDYPLNIYCVSACELLHITREAVTDFLHSYPFVMQYVRSLSANSQGMNRKITMLTQKTLRENLLDYLKQQAGLQHTSVITLPISKKELADYLGVQRPSLFRELKKLRDEKILEIDRRSVRLLQIGAQKHDKKMQ